MPGLVVAIPVRRPAGEKGDVLIVLESMKMQNELKSPRDGVASRDCASKRATAWSSTRRC